MDAYRSQSTDALGRRNGPRHHRPLAEKRRIVEEALQPGASVAEVARRYSLNANVVFGWRRHYQAGKLGAPGSTTAPGLVPVKLIPSESAATEESPACVSGNADVVEVRLSDGTHVRVTGKLAHEALRQIIAVVRAR